ncbi:hypothetical protein ACFQH8_20985 [Halomicroarcula sp. GCM10025710]
MVPALQTVLFGHHDSRFQRTLGVLFATGLLISTFVAYALGFFEVTGGVLVLPGDATIVGLVAAIGIGSRRGGLAFAWLALFAAYVGFRADWAFLGLSSHSLAGKPAFLFDPVGLAVFAVATVSIGTVGFSLGYFGQWALS